MTNRFLNHAFALITIGLGLVALPGRSNAGTYYVDWPNNYSYQACGTGMADVPDYEWPIRNGLNSLGWTGWFYQNGDAYPQDFIDPALDSDGADNQNADSVDVAIFCGHANTGRIVYSWPHNNKCCAGACNDQSSSNILLGAGSGAQAASVVVIGCCYANVAYQSLILDHNYEKQLMGFGSPAQLDNSMVSNYYQATAGTSNIDAWLNNMEDRPGWFSGDNTTVVMSRGTSPDNLTWNKLYCGLKRQNCVSGGGGGGYWSLNWHDHGCGGCAGC